jgi:hypothetical protein
MGKVNAVAARLDLNDTGCCMAKGWGLKVRSRRTCAALCSSINGIGQMRRGRPEK